MQEVNGIRIDSHVHVLPEARLGGLMRWIKRGFPAHPVSVDVSARDILSDLQAEGVTHFFNFAYPLKVEETEGLNEWNLDFCKKTPGAIPFASLHQDTQDKAKVARAYLDSGFLGFKFHPFVQKFDPWDERMLPFYEAVEEEGKPVFFHTGFEAFYAMKMPTKELEGLLGRFPRLPVIFVHMAFPDLAWAFRMLDEYPYLYLDATNVLSCVRPPFQDWLKNTPGCQRVIEELLEGLEKYHERVMFGSDHPAGMGGLSEIYRDLEDLGVSESVKESLKAGTAKSFIERFAPGFDWSSRLGGAR